MRDLILPGMLLLALGAALTGYGTVGVEAAASAPSQKIELNVEATPRINRQVVAYTDGDTALEGVFIYDENVVGPRPGILIVHQWLGISEHEEAFGKELAAAGYAVFLADIYGAGKRPANAQEASQTVGTYRADDRSLFRSRLVAGLGEMRGMTETVDPTKCAAIGFCFGGTGVLELARINADVLGVVSFHGGLSAGSASKTADVIQPKVLVLHGAADPYVPPAEVNALMAELDAAKADWQLVSYSNAVHSFTDKKAASDASRYDEKADRRSRAAMHSFFDELFGKRSHLSMKRTESGAK